MEEVIFLERETLKGSIKISNERVILNFGSRERTILIKGIHSFDVLDHKSRGIICIIIGIFAFIFPVGEALSYNGLSYIGIIIAVTGLVSFVNGMLYLTKWRFTLEVFAISGKINFPISSFGNNGEIHEAIRKAILYKPNDSEKLMNNSAANSENEPPKRLDTYGNVASKPLNKETSTTYSISQELQSKYVADIESAGFAEWVAELKICNVAFETLVKKHFDEIAVKTDIIVKEARMQFDEAYRALAERINTLIISAPVIVYKEKEPQGTAQPLASIPLPLQVAGNESQEIQRITQSDYKVHKSNKKEEKKAADWLL